MKNHLVHVSILNRAAQVQQLTGQLLVQEQLLALRQRILFWESKAPVLPESSLMPPLMMVSTWLQAFGGSSEGSTYDYEEDHGL